MNKIINIIMIVLGYIPGLLLLGIGWCISMLGSLLINDKALGSTLKTIITLADYKNKLNEK